MIDFAFLRKLWHITLIGLCIISVMWDVFPDNMVARFIVGIPLIIAGCLLPLLMQDVRALVQYWQGKRGGKRG